MATASTRSVWNGAISFGLVHIPVALYTAVAATRPTFNLIDKASMSPVGNKQVAKTSGEAVQRDELVKRSLRSPVADAKASRARPAAANDEASSLKKAAAGKTTAKARASVKPAPRRKAR